MLKKVTIFLILAAGVACQGFHPASTPSLGPKPADTGLLFPRGIYQHKITLIPLKGKQRTFTGIVSLGENQIQVVGLSPFNTTFIRIKDTFNPANFEAKFYVPMPQKAKRKFYEFYASLKEVLLLKKYKKTAWPPGLQVQTDKYRRPIHVAGYKTGVHFDLSSYDEKNIPRIIHVNHPFFKLLIEVTSYEL